MAARPCYVIRCRHIDWYVSYLESKRSNILVKCGSDTVWLQSVYLRGVWWLFHMRDGPCRFPTHSVLLNSSQAEQKSGHLRNHQIDFFSLGRITRHFSLPPHPVFPSSDSLQVNSPSKEFRRRSTPHAPSLANHQGQSTLQWVHNTNGASSDPRKRAQARRAGTSVSATCQLHAEGLPRSTTQLHVPKGVRWGWGWVSTEAISFSLLHTPFV